MAKVNAPLFSFNASGKIAKALVYFCWKGLDVVRSYVVPSNPKTAAQTTHRGYLSAAVTAIHVAQALAANSFVALDAAAYALWGSCFATPRTWFNQAVKNWIDTKILGNDPMLWYDCQIDTSTPGQIDVDIDSQEASGGTAKCFYGTSKTALINSVACTGTPPNYLATIPSTVAGVKYFFQIRIDAGQAAEGAMSGIYYDVGE